MSDTKALADNLRRLRSRMLDPSESQGRCVITLGDVVVYQEWLTQAAATIERLRAALNTIGCGASASLDDVHGDIHPDHQQLADWVMSQVGCALDD